MTLRRSGWPSSTSGRGKGSWARVLSALDGMATSLGSLVPDDEKRQGSPTGGGNFYIFKKSTPAQQAAALKFAQFVTSPERAAQWGIDTGYVAVRPDAFDTPAMKAYVASFPPAAVARDQLKVAVAEFSTHENQRVVKVFSDNLQAALTGAKTAEAAMKDAQREADRLLKPFR